MPVKANEPALMEALEGGWSTAGRLKTTCTGRTLACLVKMPAKPTLTPVRASWLPYATLPYRFCASLGIPASKLVANIVLLTPSML
jgi:hypothetical protein